MREITKVQKDLSTVSVILYIYILAKLFLFLIYELKYKPDQRNEWRDMNLLGEEIKVGKNAVNSPI